MLLGSWILPYVLLFKKIQPTLPLWSKKNLSIIFQLTLLDLHESEISNSNFKPGFLTTAPNHYLLKYFISQAVPQKNLCNHNTNSSHKSGRACAQKTYNSLGTQKTQEAAVGETYCPAECHNPRNISNKKQSLNLKDLH